jgi:MFS transporter, DHA1 family, multidrug resistance protein
VFLALAGLGLVFVGCAYAWVGETLPLGRRRRGGLADTTAVLLRVAADRGFTGYALAGGFAFAAMFAYISASPFIFEGLCHLTPQLFAMLIALNATGILLANIINARLVRRFSPRTLLDVGLVGVAVGAVGTLVVVVTTQHRLYLYALVAPLFLMVSSFGLTRPNAAALALDRHPESAGSAAAIVGMIQYALGATAAPITGLGRHSAIPLGLTVVAAAALAVIARILTRQPMRHPKSPVNFGCHERGLEGRRRRAGQRRGHRRR